MFPETKSRISMVEGNIEIFRKQNSLFPSGPVIKCLLFYEESVSWLSIVQTRKIICYIAGVFFSLQRAHSLASSLSHGI